MDNIFGQRLRELRKAKGYTLKDMANRLGFSAHSTYSNWEYGRANPSNEDLAKLSNLYDVSMDYLLTGKERERKEFKFEKIDYVEVPLLGTIRAGMPIDRYENIEGAVPIPSDYLNSSYDTFALTVQGESMAGDELHEGDKVICYATPDISAHEIAVVAINGDEATLKRVKQEGDMCILLPSNREFEPQIVKASSCHILGKVAYSLRQHGNRK